MLVTCINGQGLDSSIVSNVIGGRYHRVLLRIGRRQVVHLQRGDLGKVSNDLLILLTVLDTGYYKSERLLSDFFMCCSRFFLLEKVAIVVHHTYRKISSNFGPWARRRMLMPSLVRCFSFHLASCL